MVTKNDVSVQLLEWSFDWKYMVRGLVLDKKRGNILKVRIVYFLHQLFVSNEQIHS